MRLGTTSAGSVLAPDTADDCGKLPTESGSTTTPLRFPGPCSNQALAAGDLQARWQDPGSTQFLSVDPLAAATRTPFCEAAGTR